jgi:hypothetical protein
LEVKIPRALPVSTIFQNLIHCTFHHHRALRSRLSIVCGTGPVGYEVTFRKPQFSKTCLALASVYAISCV